MQKFKVIRVTMEVDYVLPMATDCCTIINGWTPEEVRKEWFERYDINSSHASRDGYRLGNGAKVIKSEVLDGE